MLSFLPYVTGVFLALNVMARAVEVTTADNASGPGDGQTSLLEAITGVQANETITFNIPGPGPHYIVTPVAGYPLITQSGVTIDGWSQPGSSPNTAGPRQVRNEVMQIVLDSRTDQPGERRTVIDYPGFGTSESCVLGFLDAQNVVVRGLAFIGVSGQDNSFDPHVYNIALIKESKNAKIQGCWFGLDPGVSSWKPGLNGVVAGVYGARSAVASFQWDGGLNSSGLIFGTDGDGTDDEGEGNVCMAQRLAVHLQTPSARISGNWINVFPDGSMLNLATQGLELEDGTLEAIENGDPSNMTIGTNGDGTSDLVEGNIFGPVVYDAFVEFWRSGNGNVFAGNLVGAHLNGLAAFASLNSGLIFLRNESSIRIGSNLDGFADAEESNIICGLQGPFIQWSGNNNDAGTTPARVSLRGNELIANAGGIPLSAFVVVTAPRVFGDVMANPFLSDVVINEATATTLSGTVPVQAAGLQPPVLDVYLADPFGVYLNSPQGRVYLGSFAVDSVADLDANAGAFSFDISSLGLSAEEAGHLTATATYTLGNGRQVTSNFAIPLMNIPEPPPLGDASIVRNGDDVTIAWPGGTAPFLIEAALEPGGPWSALTTTAAQALSIPISGEKRFFRVHEGARPR